MKRSTVILLVAGILCVTAIVNQLCSQSGESVYATSETDYPYELVGVKLPNGDASIASLYYKFNKMTGDLELAGNAMLSPIPEYKIVPNVKGGCFIMDPRNGRTIMIDAKGQCYTAYEGYKN